MRKVEEVFERKRFDLITCMGNTLVHLGSYAELCRFFDSVYSLLNKQGVFAAQIVNYDNVLINGVNAFKNIEDDEFLFVRENEIIEKGEKIEFSGELIIKKTGEKFRNKVSLYPADSNDVMGGLDDAGFSLIKFYGDFDKGTFSETSNALIFIAEK